LLHRLLLWHLKKLTKESFLKGSDEFKLEEVIAEFERKGIDEKYYKDLGEEGKGVYLRAKV
jgi:hypothetical protein